MRIFFGIVLITLLGLFLRVVDIDKNPPALNWDYASLGYNAFSILKTGADEYGTSFPLIFRSFDTYMLPLGIYVTVPFIALFGLTEMAVRLPAVVFGSLMIPLTFLLVRSLAGRSSIALMAMLFLAISPWHIQYSREASISILFVFFVVLGTWLFLSSSKRPILFPFSLLSFVLSFYTYHAAVVFGVCWFLALVFIRHSSLPPKRWLIFSLLLFALSMIPLVRSSLSGEASDRLRSTGVIYAEEDLRPWIERIETDQERGDRAGSLLHNRRIFYGFHIIRNYLAHWRFDYLFFDGMANRMFRIPDMGLLYLWDLPFLLLGLWIVLKKWREMSSKMLLAWLLIAPIPSALAWGAPSSLRVVTFLPLLQIVVSIGFLAVWSNIHRMKRIFKLLVITLLVINVMYFLHQLFIHTPIEAAESWNYSVKHAVQEVMRVEDQYEKIIFTYHYKQPYIYYLFYNQIDPSWFQQNWYPGEIYRRHRTVGNIDFRSIRWQEDQNLSKTLIVGTPQEFPINIQGVIKTIASPDGTPTLLFVEPQPTPLLPRVEGLQQEPNSTLQPTIKGKDI